MSILDICKMLMYEFWYDYIKPKYNNNAKLCHIETGSFVTQIKTNNFYENIKDDVKVCFDSSNCTEVRPLPTVMNKKVSGLMKVELGGKIKIKFI